MKVLLIIVYLLIVSLSGSVLFASIADATSYPIANDNAVNQGQVGQSMTMTYYDLKRCAIDENQKANDMNMYDEDFKTIVDMEASKRLYNISLMLYHTFTVQEAMVNGMASQSYLESLKDVDEKQITNLKAHCSDRNRKAIRVLNQWLFLGARA